MTHAFKTECLVIQCRELRIEHASSRTEFCRFCASRVQKGGGGVRVSTEQHAYLSAWREQKMQKDERWRSRAKRTYENGENEVSQERREIERERESYQNPTACQVMTGDTGALFLIYAPFGTRSRAVEARSPCVDRGGRQIGQVEEAYL